MGESGQSEERIVTQTGERRLVSWIVSQAKSAKTARIGECKSAMVVQHEFEFQKPRRLSGRRVELKPPRHAEMKDRPRLPIKLEPKMLAEASRALDSRPSKSLLDPARRNAGKNDRIGPTADVNDASALQMSERRFSRGFNLGQLRQRG